MASRKFRFILKLDKLLLSYLFYSGSVFTTSPVDKSRADAMKANVTKKVVAYGDFKRFIEGSPQYVNGLTTAIVQAAQFSMNSLRNLIGKPTQL